METVIQQIVLDKPRVWLFRPDTLQEVYYSNRVFREHPETGYDNEGIYGRQVYLHAKKHGIASTTPLVFSSDMPPLIFNYPMENSILPDFLNPLGYPLCSARLRAAMALAPGVVQYLPVDVRATDPRVHAMSYQALHVIARQPTIDLRRSDVEIEVKVDRHIGGTYTAVKFWRQFILNADLQPQTDLFHPAEVWTVIFATDALAERVMKAGCLGVAFEHPEQRFLSDEPKLIRTARGIELAGPKARRAHLRWVKRARMGDAAANE